MKLLKAFLLSLFAASSSYALTMVAQNDPNVTLGYLVVSSMTCSGSPCPGGGGGGGAGAIIGTGVIGNVPSVSVVSSNTMTMTGSLNAFSSSVTIPAPLGLNVTYGVTASTFTGNGAALTNLTGANVGSGVPAANIAAGNLGASVVSSSIAFNSVYPAAVSAGTYANITLPGANVSGNISGNAANISGNLPVAQLSGNLPATQIAAGTLPALNGSNLTNLAGANVGSGIPAANIASGNLGASVIASSIAATTVTPGQWGSTTIVPVLTIAGDGRITSVSSATIAAGGGVVTSTAVIVTFNTATSACSVTTGVATCTASATTGFNLNTSASVPGVAIKDNYNTLNPRFLSGTDANTGYAIGSAGTTDQEIGAAWSLNVTTISFSGASSGTISDAHF